MNTLDNKLIIYDSDCKVCTTLKNVLISITPGIKNKVVAYRKLSSALKLKVDPMRFKNEMALIDIDNDQTLYGAEGISFIFSSKSKVWAFFFRNSALGRVFTFLYKTLAFNRYIIATPRNFISCDCFPDKVITYRIAYIVVTVILASALTALFGVSLKGFFPTITFEQAAIHMLLIAGTGWVLQIMFALFILKKKVAVDYIGHLGSIMIAGLLILIPWMIFRLLTGLAVAITPILSVALSSGFMLYLHISRVRTLEIPGLLNYSWFFFLQLSALYWIYTFYFNA